MQYLLLLDAWSEKNEQLQDVTRRSEQPLGDFLQSFLTFYTLKMNKTPSDDKCEHAVNTASTG